MSPPPGSAAPSGRDSGPFRRLFPSPVPEPGPRAPLPSRTYRFGDGLLALESADRSLSERFRDLFGECEAGPEPAPAARAVRCRVETPAGSSFVRAGFETLEPVDLAGFCGALLQDRGYREIPGGPSPWRFFGASEDPLRPLVAASGTVCLFDASAAWQPLHGNLALNLVLLLQRDTLFVHAASLSLAGRGVLMPGGKGAGKTTLALALASRGHGFLGDEIGAVRAGDGTLLPVRRSVSIREGPAGAKAAAAIASGRFPTERYPDGSLRTRAPLGAIFPSARARPAPLRAILLLGERRARAACVPIRPGREVIERLPLSAATLWGASRPRLYLALMRLLGRADCFDLHAGEPDETADLVERTVAAL